MRSDVATYFAGYKDVPGWFAEEDFRLFDWLLTHQRPGSLLEIGAFQGSSAILLGLHRRNEETITVCDLFGSPEPGADGEESEWYQGLTRKRFERSYRTFVPVLPAIVQESSLRITDHVAPESCRFVHIDGCHLYDYVRSDLAAARVILNADGIVVCDDWRTLHTPGVTAAVLEEMVGGELDPIVVTASKFYGSWNAKLAAQLRADVVAWVGDTPELGVDVQSVRGMELPRVYVRPSLPSYSQRGAAKIRRAPAKLRDLARRLVARARRLAGPR